MLWWLMIVAVALWGAVAVWGAFSLTAIWRKEPRRGDPARLLMLAFGALMIGFTLRRLLSFSDEGLIPLYAVSILLAVATLRLMRVYGRGGRV